MTDGGPQRRALITGGASGFGLATAAALLERGDRVTIADIDRRQLDATRAALLEIGLHAVEIDVARPASVRDTVETHLAAYGGLDWAWLTTPTSSTWRRWRRSLRMTGTGPSTSI